MMCTIITALSVCNGYLQNVDVRSINQEEDENLNVNITEILRQKVLAFRKSFHCLVIRQLMYHQLSKKLPQFHQIRLPIRIFVYPL